MVTSLLPRPDEQPDTLPEGLPVGDVGELHIEIVSAISGEAPESALPTRKGFDEEPTRKKHAPKPPKNEVTDVTDLHELFKNWR